MSVKSVLTRLTALRDDLKQMIEEEGDEVDERIEEVLWNLEESIEVLEL